LEPGQQFEQEHSGCAGDDLFEILEDYNIVQGVTVVKLGVHDGGGNRLGGVKVKVGTDTAESTNVPQAATAAAAELLSQSNRQRGRIQPLGR